MKSVFIIMCIKLSEFKVRNIEISYSKWNYKQVMKWDFKIPIPLYLNVHVLLQITFLVLKQVQDISKNFRFCFAKGIVNIAW